MKTLAPLLVLLFAIGVMSCSQPGSMSSSPQPLISSGPTAPTSTRSVDQLATAAETVSARALSATVDFGRDDLGSPFPPPSGHDESGHSRDSLFPREVVIAKGGTVTFMMGASGVHEVAIYQPGTDPGDINTSLLDSPAVGCPPVPTINDPDHRLAIVADQACEGGSHAPSYTFSTPGRYLVICTFLPHFNVGMYGWVTVRD